MVLFAEEATAHLATKGRVDRVRDDLTKRIDTTAKEINARTDTMSTEVAARITAAGKRIAQVKEYLGKEIRIAPLRKRFWLGSMVSATGFAVSAYISWMFPLMLDARPPPQ